MRFRCETRPPHPRFLIALIFLLVRPAFVGLLQFDIGMAGTSKSYEFDVVLMGLYII